MTRLGKAPAPIPYAQTRFQSFLTQAADESPVRTAEAGLINAAIQMSIISSIEMSSISVG
jgi:hypothetical protein